MLNTSPVSRPIKVFLLGLCLVAGFQRLYAQYIPIGSPMDDALRSMQLLEKIDSSVSFTTRPFSSADKASVASVYSFLNPANNNVFGKPLLFAGGKGKLAVLPLTLTQQFNSHHPYGWNDGSMIAAKGYQFQASAGVYAALGPVEVQLQPEFVYAANAGYENTVAYGNPAPAVYSRVFPGQSRVQVSWGGIAAGLSSANIWWGPGIYSSLLMSNNAPGFVHGYLSSKRPLKTPIGHFEFQLIGGKATSEKGLPYENAHLKERSYPLNARYLSAYVVSYQPKWIPGVFVGMTRALQRYKKDVDNAPGSFLDKYIPVLSKPFTKKNSFGDDTLNTDQLASFFMRWLLQKAHAELYVEYGFNDYGVNVRDYLMAPTHSAAYTVGLRKIFLLNKADSRVEAGIEVTQMSESPDYLVRPAGNWYEHSSVVQGYTNNNQIMGAGAGMGANVQTLTATWVQGNKQLGILLQRVERDPLNHTSNWVDLGIGFVPQWTIRNMIIGGKLQFINSNQYAWQKDVNRFNLHARCSIKYLF